MIDHFTAKNRFLSNFYPCKVWYEDEYDGRWYPSTEHAYQAAKSIDPKDRKRIASLVKARDSKREGGKLTLRQDWEKIKLEVMYNLVKQKFFGSKDLGDKLLATGDEELIEGNTWDDKFWGCVKFNDVPRWVGSNHLGKILMQVRAELKNERMGSASRS